MIDDILAVSKCGIDTVEVNTLILIENGIQKLRLSEDKCGHIHVTIKYLFQMMNKTKQYILQMNIHLNPYIQKFTEKWIKPLLLDSGCSQIMPNLRQWKFEQIPNPRMEEWPRLAQHQITEDSNEKTEREIIPINGKIKLNNNIISLELLLKFVAIRTDVTDQEIEEEKKFLGGSKDTR